MKPDIPETLEHKPEKFLVRRIIHNKYIARDKSDQMESTAITPPFPILPYPKVMQAISY